uniref:SCAN box domain-containing protein n=1 Tax=Latimeria chalumnae TaxID=7897 RepID=H3A5V1_LATCH
IRTSHFLQKMTLKDDVEAYLLSFERCAEWEAWSRAQWDGIVAPVLVGDAQKAYFNLEPEATSGYTLLKTEILARAGVTPMVWAQRFHTWNLQEGKAPRSQMFDLVHLAWRWLQPEINTPVRIVELLMMDRYLRALPPAIRKWIRQGDPVNAQELIALVERQVVAEELTRTPTMMGKGGTKERSQTMKGLAGVGEGWSKGSRGNGDLKKLKRSFRCYWYNELEHIAVQCPNAVEPMQCNLGDPECGKPMKVNGKEMMALTDSSSAVTLVCIALVRPSHLEHSQKTSITCMHGDVNFYPTTKVEIEVQNHTFDVMVGVVSKFPHPVIIGRDFPE